MGFHDELSTLKARAVDDRIVMIGLTELHAACFGSACFPERLR
jgi:hypothetical protein